MSCRGELTLALFQQSVRNFCLKFVRNEIKRVAEFLGSIAIVTSLLLLRPSFFSRQILHSEPPTLGNKFKDWASSKWNILDGFAVVSFFVGLGLRLHPTTRSAGHVIYCLDVMLWIIRLLDIFSVSKHLGPYVVMIGRMVTKCFISSDSNFSLIGQFTVVSVVARP